MDVFVPFLQSLAHLEHVDILNKEISGFAPARRSGINALANLRTPDDVFQWLLGSVPSDKFFKSNWERYAARLPGWPLGQQLQFTSRLVSILGILDLNGCKRPGILY
jgi:hypothetical protein